MLGARRVPGAGRVRDRHLFFGYGPLGAGDRARVALAMSSASYLVRRPDRAGLDPGPARSPAEEEPRLHNIVEGLAIAAGCPKPRVYVVPEQAPNAFATGRDPEHSSIAVTRGPAGHDEPRRARGRDRARDVARPRPRHPARHGRGHAGRRRRAAVGVHDALVVVGRVRRAPGNDGAAAAGGAIVFAVGFVLLASRRSRARSSSCRSRATASTWPTRRARCSPGTRPG